jgi:hypothetical protein
MNQVAFLEPPAFYQATFRDATSGFPARSAKGPGCLILRGGTLTPGGFAIKHRPDK